MPTNCNPQINDDNRKAAIARDSPEYRRAIVTIHDTDGEVIKFSADGSPLQHTALWKGDADTWPSCPSDLPSNATKDDVGMPPSSGTGRLYLSVDYLQSEREAGRSIIADDPKWPRGLPGKKNKYEKIPFRVTSIVVSGVELVSGKFAGGTFELMKVEVAAPAQTITYTADSRDTSLSLSRDSIESLGLAFQPFSRLAEAAAVIEAPRRDSRRLAWAWSVVDACVNGLARAREAGHANAEHEAVLRHLLGDDAIGR